MTVVADNTPTFSRKWSNMKDSEHVVKDDILGVNRY